MARIDPPAPTDQTKRDARQGNKPMIEYVTYRHAYGKGYVNMEPSAHAYNIPQHWLIPTWEAFNIASV